MVKHSISPTIMTYTIIRQALLNVVRDRQTVWQGQRNVTEEHKERGETGHECLISPLKKTAATYSPCVQVPSALLGLTSLFGMVRGGSPTL